VSRVSRLTVAAALATAPLLLAGPSVTAATTSAAASPSTATTTIAAELRALGLPDSAIPGLTDELTALAASPVLQNPQNRLLMTAAVNAWQHGKTKVLMALASQVLADAGGGTATTKGGSENPNPPATAPASPPPMVLGYYVPGTAAWNDLVAHASQITAIAPLWYSIRPDGSLHTLSPNTAFVTSWAHAHHVAVYPLVINGYGNDNMLQNASMMQQDVSALVNLVQSQGYDGLNLDFEGLNNPDETGLNAFAAQLAAGLHQIGKKLIVSVGPRTSDQNGYHVYNYRFLGHVADWVDLMTYDDHDNGGPSGPVAPLGWVNSIVQYAVETMPSSKILVGLAGYGYNWSAAGSTEINDAQALALANQYGVNWVGGTVQEPEITYTDQNGVAHTVWFEDAQSEAPKAALVGQDHLGGVALWDLGEENGAVWPMLAQTLPH
jgi:spore germination protein